MSGIWFSIAVMSAVTVLLRAAPFILLRGKKTPPVIDKLARLLPCAVMGMLVVYCLRGTDLQSAAGWLPALAAAAVTVASYAFKRNTLLSIISGTAVYMILIRVL